MVKNSKVLFFYGGLSLLMLLAAGFYLETRHVPVPAPLWAFIVVPLIILVGIIGGWHFARQDYLGRALHLDQLQEGEYRCNKYAEWIIIMHPISKPNPRLILVQSRGSIEPIPLGADFTLIVSTEKGRWILPGEKKLKRFTRRLFKAAWRDPVNGKFCDTQWSIERK